MGCDIHMIPEYKDGDVWIGVESDYDGRNYELFAILANVRNRHDIIPISEPRGIPEKPSILTQNKLEAWGGDAHSKSWLSLKDIKSFDWFQVFKYSGVLSEGTYLSWKEACKAEPLTWPDMWSQGAYGPKIITINEIDYPKLTREPEAEYYINCEWEASYLRACLHFLESHVPKLNKLGKKYGDDNVRIIFFFDN